jgi:hypothetical protein
VTEQPYKIPFYAALIRRLYRHVGEADDTKPTLGQQILDDFWKGFQAYLDKLAWRETRYCVRSCNISQLSSDPFRSLTDSFLCPPNSRRTHKPRVHGVTTPVIYFRSGRIWCVGPESKASCHLCRRRNNDCTFLFYKSSGILLRWKNSLVYF